MSKFKPSSELSLSPITLNGEVVLSRLGSAVQEQDGSTFYCYAAGQIYKWSTILAKWELYKR